MPIFLGFGLLLSLVAVFGPSWWVRHVLAHHGVDRPDLPGTGAELARNLLDEAGLQAVTVEVKTSERRIIEFLLSPLLRYKQESLRER